MVSAAEVKVVGSGQLPAPKAVSIEQLALGRDDCLWVQVEGVVHRAAENWGHLVLDLVAGTSRLKVRILERQPGQDGSLIDANVRVQGVVAASHDSRKRLDGFHLLVPSLQHVTTLEPAPRDPFAGTIRTGRGLKVYLPGQALNHRVHVRGLVTLYWPERALFIRDESGGIRVGTEKEVRVEPGEMVDVVGFPVLGELAPTLVDASFETDGKKEPPRPLASTPEQAQSGNFDNELVKMEAWVVASEEGPADARTFVLRTDKSTFHALLPQSQGEVKASRILPGSRIQVTGICDRETTKGGVPMSFNLLLRSPQDILLLEQPLDRKSGGLTWVLWGLALSFVFGLGWVALWWKRVEQKAEAVRCRESALEQSQNEEELRKALEVRERIARDLHDSIIQSIYAIGLNLDNCKRLVNEKPADVERQLAKVLADLNGVIRDVRNFILGLESDALKGQEFKTALKSIVLTLGEAHATRFSLQIDPLAAENLTSQQATQLLHIAREAVSNSVRHAQAERTVLSLQPHKGHIRFEVRDNGVGFDPHAAGTARHGLPNMAVRARELGATFSVDSQFGQGTRIVLDILMENTHESA